MNSHSDLSPSMAFTDRKIQDTENQNGSSGTQRMLLENLQQSQNEDALARIA